MTKLRTLVQLFYNYGDDETDFEEKEFSDGMVEIVDLRKWIDEIKTIILKNRPDARGWEYRMSISSDDYPDGRLALSCSCPGCGLNEFEIVGAFYEQEYYRVKEEIADGTIKYFEEKRGT